jgi:hypothetical protein
MVLPLRSVLMSLGFTLSPLRSRSGQAAVEMAVVMPVLLAVVGITINLMVYLGDCARFDRVAAEAVRTAAASPGYGDYGTAARAQKVQTAIEASFAGDGHLSFSVVGSESSLVGGGAGSGGAGGAGGGSAGGSAGGGAGGVGFSLLPHHETFVCKMNYRPWRFGSSFFGVEFTGIPHTRSYVIDPYRPGVLL